MKKFAEPSSCIGSNIVHEQTPTISKLHNFIHLTLLPFIYFIPPIVQPHNTHHLLFLYILLILLTNLTSPLLLHKSIKLNNISPSIPFQTLHHLHFPEKPTTTRTFHSSFFFLRTTRCNLFCPPSTVPLIQHTILHLILLLQNSSNKPMTLAKHFTNQSKQLNKPSALLNPLQHHKTSVTSNSSRLTTTLQTTSKPSLISFRQNINIRFDRPQQRNPPSTAQYRWHTTDNTFEPPSFTNLKPQQHDSTTSISSSLWHHQK